MTTHPRADARSYLDAAKAAGIALSEVRSRQHQPKEVAALADDLRTGLQFARVHALLAIEDRLHALVLTLDRVQGFSTEDVAALVQQEMAAASFLTETEGRRSA